MMSGMLATMCDRGPDSAGFAVYGAATAPREADGAGDVAEF